MRLTTIKQNLTLTDIMNKFLLVKESQGTGYYAMRDYKAMLSKFMEYSSGSLDYDTLEDEVLKFFSDIPDSSPAIYNKPYQCLTAFFTWASENRYIEANPIKVNKLKKRKDDGNIKPVGIDELKIFLDSFDRNTFVGLRNWVMCYVMLDTGIRTSELCNLHISDYKNSTILVTKLSSKTKTTRILYLSKFTARAVEEWINIQPNEWKNEYLFSNYEGNKLTTTHLDKTFAKNSEVCGIKITPYQLRHTFATLYLKNGGDLFTLQHQMGHSNLNMTRRYTEVDEELVNSKHALFSPVMALQRKKCLRV